MRRDLIEKLAAIYDQPYGSGAKAPKSPFGGDLYKFKKLKDQFAAGGLKGKTTGVSKYTQPSFYSANQYGGVPMAKGASAVGEVVNSYIDGYLRKNAQVQTQPPAPQTQPPAPQTTPPAPQAAQPAAKPRPRRVSSPEALAAEKQRRRMNAQKIRQQNKWYNKALDGISEGWARTKGFASGFGEDLAENGLQNAWTGAVNMATGALDGLIDVGTMAGGAVGALGSGLTGHGWGNGWRAGKNFVRNIGIGDWDIGAAQNWAKNISKQERLAYMQRNGMDPNNLNWAERMALRGVDIAGAAGNGIGGTIGFNGLTGALGKGFSQVGKLGTKFMNSSAGTSLQTAFQPTVDAARTAYTNIGNAAKPLGEMISRTGSRVSNWAKPVTEPIGNIGRATWEGAKNVGRNLGTGVKQVATKTYGKTVQPIADKAVQIAEKVPGATRAGRFIGNKSQSLWDWMKHNKGSTLFGGLQTHSGWSEANRFAQGIAQSTGAGVYRPLNYDPDGNMSEGIRWFDYPSNPNTPTSGQPVYSTPQVDDYGWY